MKEEGSSSHTLPEQQLADLSVYEVLLTPNITSAAIFTPNRQGSSGERALSKPPVSGIKILEFVLQYSLLFFSFLSTDDDPS